MNTLKQEKNEDPVLRALEIISETMELNPSIRPDYWLDAFVCLIVGACIDENKGHSDFCKKIDDIKSYAKKLF